MPVLSSLPASFPLPRTRLIGREAERATARAFLLEEAVPLLTLTGPGGVGKTRLALAIAAGRGCRTSPMAWSGSIWRRSPIRPWSPATVAAALGAHARRRSVTDRRRARAPAAPTQTLLLLDNCEHLLAAAADLVAALLAALSRAAGAGHQPRPAADARRAAPARRAAAAARRDAPLRPIAAARGGAPLRRSGPGPSDPAFRAARRQCRRPSPRSVGTSMGLPLAIELAAAHSRGPLPGRPAGADRPTGCDCCAAVPRDLPGPPADDARRHRLELRPAQRGGAGRSSAAWPSSPAASRWRPRRRCWSVDEADYAGRLDARWSTQSLLAPQS